MNWLYVSTRFSIKGSRASTAIGETWAFGRAELTFDVLVSLIVLRLAQFAIENEIITPDEINSLIQKTSQRIGKIRFVLDEVKNENP